MRELKKAPIQYTPLSTTETAFFGSLWTFPFGMRVPEEGSVAEDFYYQERFNLHNFAGGNLEINIGSLDEANPKKDRRNLIYSKIEKELLPLLISD